MYCVTVTFETDAGHTDAFCERVRKQARESLTTEPACRVFDVWTSGEKPGTVFLYEIYDDRMAFDDHLASGHFKAFEEETARLVRRKTVNIWEHKQ